MNKRVDKLFVVICENEAVLIESNLSAFYRALTDYGIRLGYSESTLRSKFSETLRVYHKTESSKEYWLQKVLNPNKTEDINMDMFELPGERISDAANRTK